LIALGQAYEADGDVYFAVREWDRYGVLSGQKPDELESSGRIEPGEHKRDPLDFALWKAQKPDEDIAWDSPWGMGRPGWHIECSAMAEKFLGREFAVHGGGRDLIFPHHENELAQSCAAGRPFAQVWAHNGMLQLSGEKMSKSRGNIERLHDALDRLPVETFLMYLLRGHYAGPIDYTEDALAQAGAACATLREKLRAGSGADPALIAKVREVLEGDFNTPKALALLFEAPPSAHDSIVEVLELFGLGGLAREQTAPAELVALAERRREARAAGDYAESDRLRDAIAAAGWEVRDSASGYELFHRD
jgi:cysteinyl-tRNA synthetase